MQRRPRRLLAAAAILAIVAAASLVPRQAAAHVGLRRSDPAKGAHLAAAPRELRLTFSEAPQLAFTRIDLVGPGGAPVALGPARLDRDSARLVIAEVHGAFPAAGTYTVRWQMAGADGHPVRGSFTFVVAPGAAGVGVAAAGDVEPTPAAPHHDPASLPASTDGAFDVRSPLYVAVRWLTFTALLGVLGAVAFRFVVLALVRRGGRAAGAAAAADAAAGAARIGLWSAAALAAAAIARLYAQSVAMHADGSAVDAGLVGTMLARTTWGWGWIAQAAGALAAAAGFALARRDPVRRGGGWALAALAALVLAFTPALSGHAASAPGVTALAVLADALHVIAAGGWLGGLLVVVAAGVPAALRLGERERGPAVADIVNAFSPTALAFAALLTLTGLFAGWLHLGAVSALWQSDYGRALLLKLGVLTVVAGTGAYNWLRVRPALGDVEGARRIRRSAAVELIVGALVLAITAVLVATPPPR